MQQRPVPMILWLPYQLYKWLGVGLVVVVTTAAAGSIIIVMCFVGLGKYTRHVAGVWARLNARVTMMNVTVEGKELLQQGQSYVLAANHCSLVDIYLLYGYTGLDIRWVMKQELRRVPVLGLACDLMGHIYVDRSNSEDAMSSINAARDRITGGVCVVFFPEGTRSQNQELRPFKKGAFRMANDLGIPVVPVSIHNTHRILPSDSLNWRPGWAKLKFHEPIAMGAQSPAEVAQTTAKARETIGAALLEDG